MKNDKTNDVTFILEPWAEEFVVPPGSTLAVEMEFAKIGDLETEITDKYFIVWLWAGCRARVVLDGRDLTPKSVARG